MRKLKGKIIVNCGLESSPAWITSARATPSAVISTCSAGLFHSAIATASSSVTPSPREMPSGSAGTSDFVAG
jgi:hypothetical protein